MIPTHEQIKSGEWRTIVTDRIKELGLSRVQLSKLTGFQVTQIRGWLECTVIPTIDNYSKLIQTLYKDEL